MSIPSIPSIFLFFIFFAIFIALSFFVVKIFKGAGGSRYVRKKILTQNEAEFFRRIRKAVPEFYIFPQVGMSALIEPSSKNQTKWWEDFRHISQKRIDYGIFSDSMELIAIVELDDKMHNKENDKVRDSYTHSAGIRTLRFESRSKPTVDQLREAIRACV